ncbi:hypothetical protein BDY19DRAFT_910989, partial [Irpex rosettiformis]
MGDPTVEPPVNALRDSPPGLFYTNHTVHADPNILETLPQGWESRPPANPLSNDFNDDELLHCLFDIAEYSRRPIKAPSLMLSCPRFERHSVSTNEKGLDVHTFLLPAATLSLPEPFGVISTYARVHGILHLISDCDQGDLVTMDSLTRVEDGIRRMQTWGYVEDKGAPKVHPHWTEWEDPDAKYVRERVESRMRADMKRSVGKEGSLLRRDLLERGEQQREKVRKQLSDRVNAAIVRNRFGPAQRESKLHPLSANTHPQSPHLCHEVDQLMDASDSDSDSEPHDVSMNEKGYPSLTNYDHDLYLDPAKDPLKQQKKAKVETRGHMILRSGKVTGLSQDIPPPPFSPTLPAQPLILNEDVPPLDIAPMSPSVMTTPRTTVSSVPSLSTVTTGPHIPTPLTQSALSYHTAIMESEEGLPGAAADTLISTSNTFLPQLPTPPPDRPPSFSINLPQANQSRTFLSQYRELMAIDSSTSASSDSSSNDVPRSPSPSPSSAAATYGSSPSPSLNHQVEECHIETRPTTPNLVLMRKEKFREQLEAARAFNPIIEESEEEDSATVASSPPQDPPQDDEDMDEGDPIDPTLSNRIPYRRIIHHRFRLPSVSAQVEALVVNED